MGHHPARPGGVVLLVAVALMAMHLAETASDHGTFVYAGPALAVVLGTAAARLAIPARSGAGRLTWARAVAGASLAVVLLAPEWAEAEVRGGHEIDAAALMAHAWPALIVLLATLVILLAWRIREFVRAPPGD